MKGIIGNARDREYLIDRKYSVISDDREGRITFGKVLRSGIVRIRFDYPRGIFFILRYDSMGRQTEPGKSPPAHSISNLRNIIND